MYGKTVFRRDKLLEGYTHEGELGAIGPPSLSILLAFTPPSIQQGLCFLKDIPKIFPGISHRPLFLSVLLSRTHGN